MKKINWIDNENGYYYGHIPGAGYVFQIQKKGKKNPVFILKSVPIDSGFFTRANNLKVLGKYKTIKEAQEQGESKLSLYLSLFLHEAPKADPDTIIIKWCSFDVQERAKEHEIELTDMQARWALHMAEKYHDCNYGITWEHFDSYIDEVLNPNKNTWGYSEYFNK